MHELLSENWFIADDKLQSLTAVLASVIQGKPQQQAEEEAPKLQVACRESQAETINWFEADSPDIPEGSVLVLPLRGIVFKYGYSGWYSRSLGTLDYMQLIKAANENPKIKSILMVVDSPGGQVTNTDRLAEVVATSKKPVFAFVEGMAASAAVYIIAGAKKIVASSNIDRIGSIGTMFSYMDIKPYYESMGIKIHEFNATKSPDKNKDSNEVLQGKYDNYRKEVLDPMNEAFHAFVTGHRNVDAAALTGKMFFAPEAQSLGLIDEIGTMEYALDMALNYVEPEPEEFQTETEPQPETKTDTNMKIKFQQAWAFVLGFLGLKAEEQEVEVTAEMMENINNEMQRLSDENAQLTQKNTDLQTAADGHASAIAAKQTEIDNLTAQVETLKGQPAAITATPEQDPKETAVEATEADEVAAFDKMSAAEQIAYLQDSRKLKK